MHLRKVVLPDPDGPMRLVTEPLSTRRSMPLRISVDPKCLRTPRASTMGAVISSSSARDGAVSWWPEW